METMRESWTDGRLDDLSHRVDRGFERVDADIRDLRMEMSARFERVDERFDRVDARFDRMDERFDAMQRTLLQVGGGIFAAFGAALIGLIATQL